MLARSVCIASSSYRNSSASSSEVTAPHSSFDSLYSSSSLSSLASMIPRSMVNQAAGSANLLIGSNDLFNFFSCFRTSLSLSPGPSNVLELVRGAGPLEQECRKRNDDLLAIFQSSTFNQTGLCCRVGIQPPSESQISGGFPINASKTMTLWTPSMIPKSTLVEKNALRPREVV